MPERFVDAIKALRHIARGNGSVLRIADRIVAAHEREVVAAKLGAEMQVYDVEGNERHKAACEMMKEITGTSGPITGELRELLADMNWTEIIDHVQTNSGAILDGDWLDHWHEQAEHVCDAIDSVHAQLERENKELRVKFVNMNRHAQHVERENEMLKEKLEERDQVDDYRAGYDDGYEDGTKSALTDMSVTHMPLPVDANGVTVHVGDVMEWCDTGDTIEVVGVGDDVVFYIENGVAEWTTPRNKRHRAPDTWKRIIEDARTCTGSAGNYTSVPSMRWANEVDALVARCKKLAGDAE